MSESDKMSESEKDQLIDAQKEVIGILFEVIKRLQTNNDLDQDILKLCKKMIKIIKEFNDKPFLVVNAENCWQVIGTIRNLKLQKQ